VRAQELREPVDLREGEPERLSPRLDEPSLASRQLPGEQIDRVDAEDGHVILIVSMEVRAMMRAADLDER